jgi:TonB family protein
MKICHLLTIIPFLLANGFAQGSNEMFIMTLRMPCYPPLARQAQLQGKVAVKIGMDKDGTVTTAQAVDGNPLLQRSATDNLRTWKIGGDPGQDLSKLTMTVVFEYKLEGEPGFERCAARVIFDSINKVEIVAHPPRIMSEVMPR